MMIDSKQSASSSDSSSVSSIIYCESKHMLYSSNGYRTVVGYELARLNIATAVQAVASRHREDHLMAGRSLNGGDGGGDGGDAEEERRTPPGDSGSS